MRLILPLSTPVALLVSRQLPFRKPLLGRKVENYQKSQKTLEWSTIIGRLVIIDGFDKRVIKGTSRCRCPPDDGFNHF